jgi:PAS domain S-box-containing protein
MTEGGSDGSTAITPRGASPSPIRVLLVDDEPEFAATAASLVEERDDRIDVTPETDPAEALEMLETDAFDCVVSDYDMPGIDGIALLNAVRERHGDFPFVLFTGEGSERVASEAVAADVDEYLRKHAVDDPYAMLASRIVNVVEAARTDRRLAEHLDRMMDAFCTIDDEWRFTFLNERAAEVFDHDADDLTSDSIWERFPGLLGTVVEDEFRTAVAEDEPTTFEYGFDLIDAELAFDVYPSETGLCVYFRDVTERNERERELRALSERLQLAVEGADVGVWDWDLRTDEVRFDDRWAAMLGYDRSEIPFELSSWEDRVHPDDLDRVWSALEAHFAGETEQYRCDHRMRSKSGEWRWIRDRGRVVERDEDGEPVRAVGIHIDVTAEKERERNLERYQRLVDELPNAVAVYDSDARFDLANARIAEVYEVPCEALIGRKSRLIERICETRDDDPFAALVAGDRETLSGTVEIDYPGLPESIVDFGLRRLVIDGEFDGVLGISHDVTEQRRRQQRLERTSARLEALYEGSPDMIDIHDETGEILDANRAMATELGYDVQELRGLNVWDIDKEMEPTEAIEIWEDTEPDETVRLETTFTRADGTTFPVEVHVRRIRVQGEVRFLTTSRNISEQKAYERRIERENERLDEFANIVSHDLRNPLNVLSGYLRLAKETGEDSYFERCERALDEMERLVEDVLTLARQGDAVGPVEPVAVDRLTNQYQSDAFGSVEGISSTDDEADVAAIDVSFETTEEVLADPGRLKRLLENLFRNAAEHGGQHVVVGDLDDGFYVADDGPGIPEDRRDEVFESGHTTSETGSGFGLAIVERITEAHGWAVTLTESESGGARFEFRGIDRP